MIYSVKDLTALIKQGESQTIEFKTSFQKEVIESVVAFANAVVKFLSELLITERLLVWIFRKKVSKTG